MNPLEAFRRLWKGKDPTFLSELTTPQRATLSVLVSHSDGNGLSFPGLDTIAASSGLGRSTVIRCLGQLEDMGLVSREVNPPSPTRYTVSLRDRPRAGPSHSETETVPERDRDRPAAGPEVPSEVPSEVPIELPRHEDGKDGSSTESRFPPPDDLPKANGQYSYPAEFEAAWSEYPSRAGGNPKKAAYRHWRARARNGTDPTELLDGVRRYARYVQATGKAGTEYVQQASTFFGPDEHWAESWELPAGGATTRQSELDEEDLSNWNRS